MEINVYFKFLSILAPTEEGNQVVAVLEEELTTSPKVLPLQYNPTAHLDPAPTATVSIHNKERKSDGHG